MFRKIIIAFVYLAGIAHLARNSRLAMTLSQPDLQVKDYNLYINEFRDLATAFGVMLLCWVFCLATANKPDSKPADTRFWSAGFWGVLAAIMVLIAGINPQGNFPWNRREAYIELAARSQKPVLYARLANPPDVLVFGSSVSFMMPMEQIEKTWGTQAFNFSLDGGSPGDYVNILNMLASAENTSQPKLILVEISNPSLGVSGSRKTPLDQIPYMASVRQQSAAVWQTFKSVTQINGLADALFTVYVVDNNRWRPDGRMAADGTLEMKTEKMSRQGYQNLVENNIAVLDLMQTCARLDEAGKASLKQLIELSQSQRFGLVIYRPPINEDTYKLSNRTPELYAPCGNLFNEFATGLTAGQPGIFYKDLSQYTEIASKGREVYRDTHHLNSRGQVLLLNALHPEISAALQWAEENR